MGLSCSHGAFCASYGTFKWWRHAVAEAAGIPPLDLMEGFYQPLTKSDGDGWFPGTLYFGQHKDDLYVRKAKLIEKSLPISWDSLKKNSLNDLLRHSDCDGTISYGKCKKIATELQKLLPKIPTDWHPITVQFIGGLLCAYEEKKPLRFR